MKKITEELEWLSNNLTKLIEFRSTKKYNDLHSEVKKDLQKQEYYMSKYQQVLKKRLNFINNNY